jgi:hypothetical protein
MISLLYYLKKGHLDTEDFILGMILDFGIVAFMVNLL